MRLLHVALALSMPATAAAHIHLTAPLSRTDDATGNPQKTQHCGGTPGRTARVTTFAPGETITVSWDETIGHPGYFRIALQPDGEAFPIPAAGPSPNNTCTNANNTTALCPQAGVPCGMPPLNGNDEGTDAATGAIVLADRIPDGTLTTQVTLPNMECSNCTLQFIQVMTDKCPYTTDAASDDIYFNCADITLAAGGATPDAGNGGGTMPDAPLGNGGGSSSTTGGCSTGGGAGWLVGLALLGLVTRRRAA